MAGEFSNAPYAQMQQQNIARLQGAMREGAQRVKQDISNIVHAGEKMARGRDTDARLYRQATEVRNAYVNTLKRLAQDYPDEFESIAGKAGIDSMSIGDSVVPVPRDANELPYYLQNINDMLTDTATRMAGSGKYSAKDITSIWGLLPPEAEGARNVAKEGFIKQSAGEQAQASAQQKALQEQERTRQQLSGVTPDMVRSEAAVQAAQQGDYAPYTPTTQAMISTLPTTADQQRVEKPDYEGARMRQSAAEHIDELILAKQKEVDTVADDESRLGVEVRVIEQELTAAENVDPIFRTEKTGDPEALRLKYEKAKIALERTRNKRKSYEAEVLRLAKEKESKLAAVVRAEEATRQGDISRKVDTLLSSRAPDGSTMAEYYKYGGEPTKFAMLRRAAEARGMDNDVVEAAIEQLRKKQKIVPKPTEPQLQARTNTPISTPSTPQELDAATLLFGE